MLLTFKNGVSEVQSVVHPGLTDLGFFVDRIQTGLMLCPPKILQPKHSTDQRAAWLKRDSNYSHIPLPFQRKNSCHPLYSKKKKKKNCLHAFHVVLMLTGAWTHISAHLSFAWQADRTIPSWFKLILNQPLSLSWQFFVKDNWAQVNGPLVYQNAKRHYLALSSG